MRTGGAGGRGTAGAAEGREEEGAAAHRPGGGDGVMMGASAASRCKSCKPMHQSCRRDQFKTGNERIDILARLTLYARRSHLPV